MPQGATITLYVKPYIHRFVVARLGDPAKLATDVSALRLRDALERILGVWFERLEHVDTFDPSGDRVACWTVAFTLRSPYHRAPSRETQDRELVNAKLESTFRAEMCTWVDFYRRSMGINPTPAMELFLKYYDIREQDYRRASALRAYHLYRNRQGYRHSRRGKPCKVHYPAAPRR